MCLKCMNCHYAIVMIAEKAYYFDTTFITLICLCEPLPLYVPFITFDQLYYAISVAY